MLGKIKNFILQSIVPNLYAFSAEKILQKKVQEVNEKNFHIEKNENLDAKKIIEELKEYHQKESKRKEIIEDKAKASLFIIALSVMLILGSLNFIENSDDSIILKFSELFILVLGIIYLLLSGITAIKAINIRKFYDVYLNDEIEESESRLKVIRLDEKDRIILLYRIIQLNQLITNIRSNYVYATFVGIRNGIILISLFFIIIVCKIYLN